MKVKKRKRKVLQKEKRKGKKKKIIEINKLGRREKKNIIFYISK